MQVQSFLNKTPATAIFKGSYALTDNGNEYYKTNNGFKVGAVYGGINFISGLFSGAFIAGAIEGGLHTGISAFIDYKRNQKAAEAADYINKVGVRQAVMTRDDIYLSTNNGKPYYKSNVGGKYGTAIGAGIGALFGILPGSILTATGLGKLRSKEVAAAGIALVAILTSAFALGGFILGKITDYFTNKAAEKNA